MYAAKRLHESKPIINKTTFKLSEIPVEGTWLRYTDEESVDAPRTLP